MFKKNNFIIWGTYCKCGNECSILQNEHHPWIDTAFTVELKCNSCDNKVIIDKKSAATFYNNKIYSFYNGLYGKVIDLGCGSGFLSRYLVNQNGVVRIYGLDSDMNCIDELSDIINEQNKFKFIHCDINDIHSKFKANSVDFLVNRDVFMFIEDTNQYFEDITEIVTKGIRQIGWYMDSNNRMKNKLEPLQIAEEYAKRGWKVDLEYLDWYKCGYYIAAYKV